MTVSSPGFPRADGLVDGPLDGVGGFGRHDDPLGPGEGQGSFEHRVLRVGDRLDKALVMKQAQKGGVAVIAEPAGVDARWHEGVAQVCIFTIGAMPAVSPKS